MDVVKNADDMKKYGHGTVVVLYNNRTVTLSDGVWPAVMALLNIRGEWFCAGVEQPVDPEWIADESFPANVVFTP